MILKKWEDIPPFMNNPNVRKYYDGLHRKIFSLLLKRVFDVIAGILALIILSPLMLIIGVSIKISSEGPILFRQVRVTQYGKRFQIFKFRTMIKNADKVGAQVTTANDSRITPIGRYLRKYRLDEIPQLLNILTGDMSFVGTRPEVVKYVDHYSDEMMATLLLPAGITSEASIHYKDEEQMLADAANAEKTYIEVILPEKMKYNLKWLEEFCFRKDLATMVHTLFAVFTDK